MLTDTAQELKYMNDLKQSRFFDDPDYSGTIRYTRAVAVLRQAREALGRTLYAWDSFTSLEPQCFAIDEQNLHVSSSVELSTIDKCVAEMRFLEGSLSQKIETFDRMKDDVSTSWLWCSAAAALTMQ